MFSVLVADDYIPWLDMLERRINEEMDLQVVARAEDGEQALELLKLHLPDVVILDIIMPKYDGSYITRYIRQEMDGYDPVIYILSGIGTSTVIKDLNELDVDFYSLKPVTMEHIIECIHNIIAHRLPNSRSNAVSCISIDNRVRQLVHLLGIPPHKSSTQCAIKTIMTYIQSDEKIGMLTKVLYPQIARERGTTASSVEKNLRDAISSMKKNKTVPYLEIFGYTNGKITNGEFLSVVARHIEEHRYAKGGGL